jgi:hypothetical protein
MKARCFRCQGTFDTDRFGTQTCPHCGAEVYLPDPAAAQPPATPPAPPPPEAAPPGSPSPYPAPGSYPPPFPPQGAAPPPWPPPPAPPAGWAPLPPGLVPPVAEQSAPFAERARRGFLPAFWETLRLVAMEPARFFRQVRVSQPGAAVLFGAIGATIGNWGALLFGWATASTTTRLFVNWSRRMGDRIDTGPLVQMIQGFTGAQLLAQAVATPLLSVLGIYLAAGVFHLLLLMVRGAPRGFEATLTVAAYASGLLMLRAVPLCGGLVAAVWFIVAAIQGLAEAQRAGSGKAAFAVLGPLVLACLCACLAGIAMGIAGFSGIGLPQPTPPQGTGI